MFFIDNETKTFDKFELSKFMDFQDDLVFDCLNSFMLLSIPKLPYIGYVTVTSKEENRPDMLSYTIYGTTQYWWIVMLYNNLLSPYDIKIGQKVYYPSSNNLEQLYTQASLNQKTQGTTN